MRLNRTLAPQEFRRRIEALATETARELERTRSLHEDLMAFRRSIVDAYEP
jgi:hypothetical protein